MQVRPRGRPKSDPGNEPDPFGGLDPKSGSEWPVMAVFKKSGAGENARVRLFWKAEMTGKMADDGKDPRGGPDP